MNRHLLLILVFVLFGLPSIAEDEIPLNCENTRAEFYRPQLFPRYEDSTRRFLLVDWNTGVESITLATDINEPIVQGWSVNCRYITAAVTTEAGYDTVVWDTVDNIRMGSIPDAIGRPHPTTWGPSEYLVVETRNGAILWNVPANTQLTLTTSFDPYTVRNFSRLRWDAINHQLIANFAVGGRTVYDLNTGQEVPLAAYTTDSVPGEAENMVTIGGKAYECLTYFRSGYRNQYTTSGSHVPYMTMRYRDNLIYMALDGIFNVNEAVQTFDGDLNLDYFRARGWSGNCHYVAASISTIDEYGRDTVVWDIQTGQRVGIFPDAQIIDHPISWGMDSMLIESRNGGYLWHLPTNTQTLITEASETALDGRIRDIENFSVIEWYENTVALVTVDQPQTIQVYDAATGTKISEYTFDFPVDYLRISDTHLAVWHDVFELVDRNTGERVSIADQPLTSNFLISPNGQYLIGFESGLIQIWDLTQPEAPRRNYTVYYSTNTSLRFENPITLVSDTEGWRLDVATGTLSAIPVSVEPMLRTSGASGYSWGSDCNLRVQYDADNRQLVLQERDTDTIIRVIATDLNFTGAGISPNCDYVIGYVSLVTSTDEPFDNHPLDDLVEDRNSEMYMIWEINTGNVVVELPHPFRWGTYGVTYWNPDGDSAFIRTTEAGYLFDFTTRDLLQIEDRTGIYMGYHWYPYSLSVIWDYQRGQVFIGARAYDLRTGQVRYTYNLCGGTGVNAIGGVYIRDNILFVSNDYTVGVWNLDTFENHCVPINTRTDYLSRTTLSPDGRYLIIARLYIRVWDLQNLPEEFMDRQPIRYHGPNARIRAVRFVSNTIIETESNEGIQYWDIETGQQVEPPG